MVNSYLRFTLACALAVLTVLTSQIKFYLGIVPYTFQNFAVILSGLILGRYGFVPQLIYIGMIALGFPASARGGGLGVLLGYTAGYIWSFPLSATIMGLIREKIWRKGDLRELVILWIGSIFAVIPLYIIGFYVFWLWTSGDAGLLNYCLEVARTFGLNLSPFWAVFFATVVIFLPQDIFMDHVMAILVFKHIQKFLKSYGIA